jgi:hypothetical protein
MRILALSPGLKLGLSHTFVRNAHIRLEAIRQFYKVPETGVSGSGWILPVSWAWCSFAFLS